MTRTETQKYLIAFVPPEPFFSEANAIKEEVKENFESKAALKSPPHITLHMPFQFKEKKENLIDEALTAFANSNSKLEIKQKGFGCFEPRVIFINVEKTEPLARLQKELLAYMRKELKTESTDYKSRGFSPHMTVAFRDLKKSSFIEAWKHYASRDVFFEWVTEELTLLKHDGNEWLVYKTYPLK